MDRTNIPKSKKISPFADSIYECAYIEPEVEEVLEEQNDFEETQSQLIAPAEQPARRKLPVLRGILAIALVLVCCVGTAIAVGSIWQNRMSRMEAAMEDRFEALKELYTQSNTANNSELPQQGLMTPGQVYAQNVDAVVAVDCLIEGKSGYTGSSGSGFLISADGYVVTNYHVVNGATSVSLTLYNGQSLDATIVGYDDTNDIALLKAEAKNLPFVKLGSSDKLVVGDQVAAIGNALGELTSTMTVGYISAKDRVVSTDGTVIYMLQTDAAINSGNSGGPLLNMNGEVVGIITAKYSGNSGSGVSIEGLGFAIPIDDVTDIISDLQQYGYVTGAYLGVYVLDVDSVAQSYGLPAGTYVQEAMSGLAADRAGIKAGDIIVNLGGYDVTSVTDLTRALRRFRPNDTTSITVYRNGKLLYLTITLDEKPVEQAAEEPEAEKSEEVPMPNEGSYEEWFKYFAPFFGYGGD